MGMTAANTAKAAATAIMTTPSRFSAEDVTTIGNRIAEAPDDQRDVGNVRTDDVAISDAEIRRRGAEPHQVQASVRPITKGDTPSRDAT